MAKVTSKLQITLPKRLAEEHGIAPGHEIVFESAPGSIRILPAGTRAGMLNPRERLRLFDEATRRADARAQALGTCQPSGEGRGWTREELYERGTSVFHAQ